MELFSKLFDITKLPSKVFAWLTLLTGAYVLSPNEWLQTVYLDKFPTEYKPYAGAVFVASASFLAINAILWAWHKLRGIAARRTNRRIVRQALTELDRNEVAALREFFIQSRHVIELPVDHPTISGLRNKRIVQVAGTTGYRDLAGSIFPVQLTDYAKALMTREILNLPERPTDRDVERIHNERPNYISQIEKTDRLRGGLYW